MQSLLSWQDTNGNTALHMAVHHSIPDMCDLLTSKSPPGNARLLSIENDQGLTPFTMAAMENDVPMFTHMYNMQRRVVWEYGPVTCYRVPLREIDSVKDSDQRGRSVLQVGSALGPAPAPISRVAGSGSTMMDL